MLKDKAHTARVDETRARVMLAEGRADEAEKVVRGAVLSLEDGGHQSLLAVMLITHGRALARLGHRNPARSVFWRAIEVAREAGATNRAGEAVLAMLDELGEHPTADSVGRQAERSLDEELKRYEAELIRGALRRAHGSVTRAARLLGIPYQRLCGILKNRHKDLETERTPAVQRKRSIINQPE